MVGHLHDHLPIEMQIHLELQVWRQMTGNRLDVDAFGHGEREVDVLLDLEAELARDAVEPKEFLYLGHTLPVALASLVEVGNILANVAVDHRVESGSDNEDDNRVDALAQWCEHERLIVQTPP